jgi:hypothetical protein
MYQNLRKKNLGGMGDGWYWSSSEGDSNHAWVQRFSDGLHFNYTAGYSKRVVLVCGLFRFLPIKLFNHLLFPA